jgi:Fe-S cluster biogenesis protein NfuA
LNSLCQTCYETGKEEVFMTLNTGLTNPVELKVWLPGQPRRIEWSDVWRYDTPNNLAKAYKMRTQIMKGYTVVCRSREEAAQAGPMPSYLMSIGAPSANAQSKKLFPGVVNILTLGNTDQGNDFITVTYRDDISIPPQAIAAIEQAIAIFPHNYASFPATTNLVYPHILQPAKNFLQVVDAFANANNANNVAEIKAVMYMVNQKLAAHGGAAHFVDYDPATESLQYWLEGNCTTCEASALTMETGMMSQFNRIASNMETPVRRLIAVKDKPAKLTVI